MCTGDGLPRCQLSATEEPRAHSKCRSIGCVSETPDHVGLAVMLKLPAESI